MMNVKNRIASFEAKNKEVSDSKYSPPDKKHDASSTTQAAAVSNTSMASQNRRNRLAADNNARQNNTTLASRRRMRQQMRRKTETTTATASSVAATTARTSSTSETATTTTQNNNSFSTTPSRHQQKVQASFQSRRLTSNRRFVHTVSHESSDEIMGSSHSNNEEGDELFLSPNRRLSPSRIAKSHRMQRMKNNGMTTTNTTTTTQQQHGSYQEEQDILLASSTNDDEATLTSVRQVVTGSSAPTKNTKKSQDIHRNFNHDDFGTTDNDTKQSWLNQGGVDPHQNSAVLRMASSSDYESDGNDHNKKGSGGGGVATKQKNRSIPPPDSAMGAFMSHNSSNHSSFRHYDEEDDRTFDYGSLLEESTHGSFDTQQREAQRKAKEEKDQQASVGFDQEASSPLINKDDVEFYKNAVDSGVAKAGVGVVAAGAVGGLLLGPVGILLSVAAVGIGVGAMQIPEEQRSNVKEKAASAVFSATDKLSKSCGTACIQSGIVDQLPPEMTQCYTGTETEEGTVGTTTVVEPDSAQDAAASKGASQAAAAAAANDTRMEKGGVNDSFNSTMRGLIPETTTHKSTSPSRRAACLREVRIVPVNQIHGLNPIQQPRAWLDVMASANTTIHEKNEAMEEIAILAKDKKHARVFLDEGILDSLMWIIRTYLTKLETSVPVSQDETFTVKLAACCCITLGKAHCALVHTGGDLLLMSMYEHGKVPEDRQLAQMLYETPHHTFEKDVFVLKPRTMPQAQELAKSITQLAGDDVAAGNPRR